MDTHEMHGSDRAQAARTSTAGLALLALGVVYGDIGTSPLYAAKENGRNQVRRASLMTASPEGQKL